MKVKPGTVADLIIRACSGERGACQQEIVDAVSTCRNTISGTLGRLVKGGLLWKTGSVGSQRFFASQEARDAYAPIHAEIIAAKAAAKAAKAAKALNRRPGQPMTERSKLVIRLCGNPQGMTLPQLRECIPESSKHLAARMLNLRQWRHLCVAGVKGQYRYFAKVDDAKAWEVAHAQEVERMKARAARSKEEKQRDRDRAKRERRQAEQARAKVERMVAQAVKARKALKTVPVKAREALKVVPVKGKAAGVVIKAPKMKFSDLPAVIPPHVKVQRLPGYQGDVRFHVDPSIADKGQISADWYERRLQEQGRG